MDIFRDKIAQRLGAQDLIRANAEAEAAKTESLQKQTEMLKKQLEQYDLCMQEMRKLNLKNVESAQILQNLAKQSQGGSVDQLNSAIEAVSGLSAEKISHLAIASVEKINLAAEASGENISRIADSTAERINQITGSSEEKIDRLLEECRVKVNALQTENGGFEELAVKLKALQLSITEAVSAAVAECLPKDSANEAFKNMEDFLHKENVKVYRNVQAVIVEELSKQTGELIQEQEKQAKGNRVVLPIASASLATGLITLALLLAHIFGVF